jgi:hypothetical protein
MVPSARLRTAMEEVITTLFTEGDFTTDLRRPSVPWTAGSIKSA